jgi:murein DD-endopeptidase MepM/ murein hydrolase activator NlpD
MYQQRGKHAQLFVNVAVVTVMVFGVALGPSFVVNDSQTQAVLASGFRSKFAFAQETTTVGADGTKVLGLSSDSQMAVDPLTQVSDKPRADIFDYTVVTGDTLAGIAKMFSVDTASIKWINPGLDEKKLKPSTVLHIPPVTGVIHTVKSGETIYSIAKRYNVSAQSIVDFPFNEFTNDETFALAIGQQLIVPDGEMPMEIITPRSTLANQLTPNAGAVSATGIWIWPTQGTITQLYKAWHKGLDIANHNGGNILAADSGTVVVAGWIDNTGYGNRVMIDHRNGYKTLYGHMSKVSVVVGQTVKRGDVIGFMGSTGRSTGTHLHFEIRSDSGNKDPLGVLK